MLRTPPPPSVVTSPFLAYSYEYSNVVNSHSSLKKKKHLNVMCSSNTSYSFTVKSNYFLHILSLSSSALKLLAPRSLTPLISVLHAFSVALLPVDYSLLKYPFLAATYSYIWPMSFGAFSLHFLRVLSWALMLCTLSESLSHPRAWLQLPSIFRGLQNPSSVQISQASVTDIQLPP